MKNRALNIILLALNKNCNKSKSHRFTNKELNEFINPYLIHVVLQHVVLSWIIDNNNHLRFDIEQHCANWVKNGPWYNIIIYSQLIGHNFEDYFKKGHNDRN